MADGVPYKYCVYTPKTKSVKDSQYEHIFNNFRDFPDEYTNRYLKLQSIRRKGKIFVLICLFMHVQVFSQNSAQNVKL